VAVAELLETEVRYLTGGDAAVVTTLASSAWTGWSPAARSLSCARERESGPLRIMQTVAE
jgi:hypothetical protein